MTRFRLLLGLVAVALVVPVALLVRSALRSVELEHEARHRIVADRLFDEMERSLSGFLEREESRPFADYATLAASPGPEAPAAFAGAPGFVVGYFHVDGEGRTAARVSPSGGAVPTGDARAGVAGIERAVREVRARRANASRAEAAALQAPGTTVALGRKPDAAAAAGERKAEEGVSTYEALRSLNKAVEQRAAKTSKERPDPSAPGAAGGSEDAMRAGEGVERSPMSGERLPGGRLLLERSAVHAARLHRQGILLDVDALGGWLRAEVVEPGALGADAAVRFAPPGAPARGREAAFAYEHRFAPPFEDVSARLSLPALDGGVGAGTVYALAALLAVAVAAGLVAIDRMVASALRWAEQRGRFVAAVTHELKTPLTAIRLYAEMLRDGLVVSEAKRDEYHRHITAESERLTRLVNNVLELARLERNAARPPGAPAPLGPVVTEAVDLARPHAEAQGFSLRVGIEPGLPPVRFDRDGLLQVLFNLVDNAVKYADGGTPKEIAIDARSDREGVTVTVRDRGPGVSPRQLGRIFEPFYRGGDELTRRAKGTGIGLALVRGLAGEMGAAVTGRNHPEGGFEVTIRFTDRGPRRSARSS